MHSYEERLSSFSSWPKDFKPAFIRKLAIMGQYALPDERLSTICIFCSKKLEDWKTTDEPLAEHMHHGNDCILFTLDYIRSRTAFCENQLSGVASVQTRMQARCIELARKGFLIFTLKPGMQFQFCIKCGAMNECHKCPGKVRRITPKSLNSKMFYIRFLKGNFLPMADSCLDTEVFIPRPAKEILRFILESTEPASAFESLESFISRGVDNLVKTFDTEARSAESAIIEKALKANEHG